MEYTKQFQVWSKALITLSAISALPVAPLALAGDEIAATPYRPTLSNPAELPLPGWLEIEAGGLRVSDRGDSRNSMPVTAKFAFDENWGILIGGDARLWQTTSGSSIVGRGDTTFTLKHRIAGSRPDMNFGVEADVKSPTAKDGLGSGKSDYGINGIVSCDLASNWRLDANAGLSRLGLQVSGQSRNVMLESASLSKTLGRWTLAGELSGSQQRGIASSHQWLTAASYAITPRFVADAGFARTQQGSDRQRSVLFGFTWLAARMF